MIRRLRVLFRLALRAITRYLTGRRWTVAMPSAKRIMEARIEEFVRALTPAHYAYRRTAHRDLLTGMLVALTAGHRVYATGWEQYKRAATRQSNYRREFATRIVGKPVVYLDRLKNKLGVTEWHQDYTPRAEVLAARRRLKGK